MTTAQWSLARVAQLAQECELNRRLIAHASGQLALVCIPRRYRNDYNLVALDSCRIEDESSAVSETVGVAVLSGGRFVALQVWRPKCPSRSRTRQCKSLVSSSSTAYLPRPSGRRSPSIHSRRRMIGVMPNELDSNSLFELARS